MARFNGGIRLGIGGTETLNNFGTLQTVGGVLVFGGGANPAFNPVYQRLGTFVTVTWPQITLVGANNTGQLAINTTVFGGGSQYLSIANDCFTLVPGFNNANVIVRVRAVRNGTTGMDLTFSTWPAVNNWSGFLGFGDPIIYAGSLTYQGV
jgi:hypothetical protein